MDKNEITIDGVVYVKKEPTHIGAYGTAITLEEPKPWPQVGDEVWVLDSTGFSSLPFVDNESFRCLLNRGLILRTEEEAERADQARIAVTTIKNYAREQWGGV